METLIIAVALNILLGTAAYIKGSVSKSGFAAGTLTGIIIYFCGGPLFWIILSAFFVSSSLLSMIKKTKKADTSKMHQKGSKRDYQQVLANSLTATALAVLYYFTQNDIVVVAFITAFAAANADTWAGEIGIFSRENPRSIITFQRLTPGTSGGVSPAGTLASYAGAFFIILVFRAGLFFFPVEIAVLPLATLIMINCGFLGSVIDSLLGATVQAMYKDLDSNEMTEKSVISGIKTQHVRGYRFMNNDMVNFTSTLASVLIAVALYTAII